MDPVLCEDIMVDLETMGTAPGCPILSVGAVAFNPWANVLGPTFYATISLESCMEHGLAPDARTITWWMQQGHEARAEFAEPGDDLLPVLLRFNAFLARSGGHVRVWGNGAAFDNTILGAAYRACKLEPGWKFWNDMCYRTIKNLYPGVPFERVGTLHNALDDAVSQAKHLCAIFGAPRFDSDYGK